MPSFEEGASRVGEDDSVSDAHFILRGPDITARFGTGGVTVLLHRAAPSNEGPHVLGFRFEGANAAGPEGRYPTSHGSYRISGGPEGPLTEETRGFREVWYSELYDSIDLRFYLEERRLKYDYIVRPGGAPPSIAHSYWGVEGIEEVPSSGDLSVETPAGRLVERAPVAYQGSEGSEEEVECRFRLEGRYTLRFAVGPYDEDRTLVIDPEMEFSTFMGGPEADGCWGIQVDEEGYIYLQGHTYSEDFPLTPGAYDTEYILHDTWVAKMEPDGSSLVYSTLLTGSHNEYTECLDIDDEGHVYVAGHTFSRDFPYTEGAYDTLEGNETTHCHVVKLSKDGSSLVYSARYGGGTHPRAPEVDVRSMVEVDGKVVIVGVTWDREFSYGMVNLDDIPDHWSAIYIITMNEQGTDLSYGAYIGSMSEGPMKAWVDDAGAIYVVGMTRHSRFPTTEGAFDTEYDGGKVPYHIESDGFVFKVNASGKRLDYSTFLGGNRTDVCTDIHVDEDGRATIVGDTSSKDFPVTDDAIDAVHSGTFDVFVTCLDASGESLVYSTFLGGTGNETDPRLDVDGEGNLYVVGMSWSQDLYVSPEGDPVSIPRSPFLAKLNLEQAPHLRYISALFGGGSYYVHGVRVGNGGAVHLVGMVADGGLPVTEGAFQPEYSGGLEGYVTKLAPIEDSFLRDKGPPTADAGPDVTVDINTTVKFDGGNSSDDTLITDHVWTFEYNETTVNLSGPVSEFEFELPGVYDVTLGVTDQVGNRAKDTVRVVVRDLADPIADAGDPITVASGDVATLDGGASHDDFGLSRWVWTFQHNGSQVSLEGERVDFRFISLGDHPVTLRVYDLGGNRDEDSTRVTVLDLTDPVARAGPDVVVRVNETLLLDGTASSDNIGIVNWTWTVLEGEPWVVHGPQKELQFNATGTYKVELMVVDAAGNAGKDEIVVVVLPPEEANGPGAPNSEEGFHLSAFQSAILIIIIVCVFILAAILNWMKGRGDGDR